MALGPILRIASKASPYILGYIAPMLAPKIEQHGARVVEALGRTAVDLADGIGAAGKGAGHGLGQILSASGERLAHTIRPKKPNDVV